MLLQQQLLNLKFEMISIYKTGMTMDIKMPILLLMISAFPLLASISIHRMDYGILTSVLIFTFGFVLKDSWLVMFPLFVSTAISLTFLYTYLKEMKNETKYEEKKRSKRLLCKNLKELILFGVAWIAVLLFGKGLSDFFDVHSLFEGVIYYGYGIILLTVNSYELYKKDHRYINYIIAAVFAVIHSVILCLIVIC